MGRPGVQTAASMEAQRRGLAERTSRKAAEVTGVQGVWGDAKSQGFEGYGLHPGLHPKDRERGYTSNSAESGTGRVELNKGWQSGQEAGSS